jgi:hypothetical protein
MDWRRAGNEYSPRLSARGPTSTLMETSPLLDAIEEIEEGEFQ